MPRTSVATKTTKTAAVKKPVKKAPAKKTVAKKAAATKAEKALNIKPVKTTFTKASLVAELCERSELDKKSVLAVLNGLEDLMLGSVHKRGVGEFNYPGLFKVTTKKIAARKGGKLATSPFTGETYTTKAKPATVRVRVRTGTKLKAAALQ